MIDFRLPWDVTSRYRSHGIRVGVACTSNSPYPIVTLPPNKPNLDIGMWKDLLSLNWRVGLWHTKNQSSQSHVQSLTKQLKLARPLDHVGLWHTKNQSSQSHVQSLTKQLKLARPLDHVGLWHTKNQSSQSHVQSLTKQLKLARPLDHVGLWHTKNQSSQSHVQSLTKAD